MRFLHESDMRATAINYRRKQYNITTFVLDFIDQNIPKNQFKEETVKKAIALTDTYNLCQNIGLHEAKNGQINPEPTNANEMMMREELRKLMQEEMTRFLAQNGLEPRAFSLLGSRSNRLS